LFETRIEDLAEHAGIAKGTLYLYFESRESLARAVVDAGFEELGRHVDAAVARERGMEARVDALIRAHLEVLAAHPDLLRVFHQARGVLKFARPEWRPLRRSLESHVARIARALAPSGAEPSTFGSLARRLRIASDLFGAISGACSVRAALGGSLRTRGWATPLRSALTAFALGRSSGTRNPPPDRPRRPRTGGRR
jgi:AcrR family transcriptional regulator